MVCGCVVDQVVCERWCVTKTDGVRMCDQVVCERLCVCLKVVCERERVTKLCMKDDVRQSGVGRMVCETTKRKVHCWIRKCKPAHSMN